MPRGRLAQQGIRQFLDIGAGLPSERIIDTGGTVGVVCADLRQPETILE
jgi:hypothetical protein